MQYAHNASDAETAGLVSKGIYSSLAIISNFSTLLDSALALTDLGGYASRVSELMEKLILEEKSAGDGFELRAEIRTNTSSNVGPGISSSEVLVEVDGVSLRVFKGRWLMRNVWFQVREEGSLTVRQLVTANGFTSTPVTSSSFYLSSFSFT